MCVFVCVWTCVRCTHRWEDSKIAMILREECPIPMCGWTTAIQGTRYVLSWTIWRRYGKLRRNSKQNTSTMVMKRQYGWIWLEVIRSISSVSEFVTLLTASARYSAVLFCVCCYVYFTFVWRHVPRWNTKLSCTCWWNKYCEKWWSNRVAKNAFKNIQKFFLAILNIVSFRNSRMKWNQAELVKRV